MNFTSFRRNFYLKRGEYQIKNGFQHFVCLEILYNLKERFFQKKIFWSSKNLKNSFLRIAYFKKTYTKRSLKSKIDKNWRDYVFWWAKLISGEKKYFYWLLISIFAKTYFWAKWDFVEIPKYFFSVSTFLPNYNMRITKINTKNPSD